tara:strand:- start:240 stop:638 length:399 start_codon:yes stop_codon:yes gene_type:complete
MGLLNNLADIGQMGSGHVKAAATTLYAPTGKVIVAIQVLGNTSNVVKFSALVADASFVASGSASVDDGVSYFGTGTQFLANGEDDDGDAVTSVVVANDVEFCGTTMIYGRWTNVSLQADNTHGIICYYGPAA